MEFCFNGEVVVNLFWIWWEVIVELEVFFFLYFGGVFRLLLEVIVD